MKQTILLGAVALLTLFMTTSASVAQVFTGGNVSVSYNDGIYIDISPMVGYTIKELRVGVSPLVSYKNNTRSDFTSYSFGGRVFSQYTVTDGVFLHAEFQMQNSETVTERADGTKDKNRTWTMGLPVGAGYEYKLNDHAKAQVTVLYDLLQDPDSPNGKPIVRGGVIYNF